MRHNARWMLGIILACGLLIAGGFGTRGAKGADGIVGVPGLVVSTVTTTAGSAKSILVKVTNTGSQHVSGGDWVNVLWSVPGRRFVMTVPMPDLGPGDTADLGRIGAAASAPVVVDPGLAPNPSPEPTETLSPTPRTTGVCMPHCLVPDLSTGVGKWLSAHV
jgi:hypothetical protein